MTDIVKKLQAQIDELEMKQAFQEQTIEELNDALTQQQFLIDKMQVQMRYLVGKVKSGQVSNIASESEETPPPHY
ncbi:SlyX family protein [Photobacterium sp. CCB-ST2H9]|uniref:SlyX family protein n=1 Tax=Photobacterium sp. CCB-ST2H9 TaxID=2912855 RepID=UPI0020048E94|nr:SlyX family protein [Photobacterium sp. CCB-ST2H9]UTM57586.1 SlyX family protein [Photobacterium sp. CCB-ST2H9]